MAEGPGAGAPAGLGGLGGLAGLRQRLVLPRGGAVGAIRGGLAAAGGAAATLRQGSAALVPRGGGAPRACLLALQGGLLVAWAAPRGRGHRPGGCLFAMCLCPGGWARLTIAGEVPTGVARDCALKVGTEGAGRAGCEVFIFASTEEAAEWAAAVKRAALGGEPVPGLEARLAAAEEALAKREREHASALEGALGEARRGAQDARIERDRADLAESDRRRARMELSELRLSVEGLESSLSASEREISSWKRRGQRAEERARARATYVEERAQELTAATAAAASRREAELHEQLEQNSSRAIELEQALAAESRRVRQLEEALAQESAQSHAREEKARALREALEDGRTALQAASTRAARLEVLVAQQKAREGALKERSLESRDREEALACELAERCEEAAALQRDLEQALRDGSEREATFSAVRASLEQSVVHLQNKFSEGRKEIAELKQALGLREVECAELAEERISLQSWVQILQASSEMSEADRAKAMRGDAQVRAEYTVTLAALQAKLGIAGPQETRQGEEGAGRDGENVPTEADYDELVRLYAKERELRAKLHERLMQLRGTVRTMVRVRPSRDGGPSCLSLPELAIRGATAGGAPPHIVSCGSRLYPCDRVFATNDGQMEVFSGEHHETLPPPPPPFPRPEPLRPFPLA